MQTATTSVEFSFNHTMNCQTGCVARGFPLGLVVAIIFVHYQKTKLFLNVKKTLIYYHYVDNTFAMFQSEDKCEEFFFTQFSSVFVTFHVRKIT